MSGTETESRFLATNRAEWHFADLGILSAAAVTVRVYPTSAASQVAYIIDHCEARVAIVENHEQLAKILEERAALPKVERVVLFDDATAALDDPFLLSLEELRGIGRDRIVPGEDGLLLRTPAISTRSATPCGTYSTSRPTRRSSARTHEH